MATKVNINGKLVSRPGVYTLIKSGIKNNPASLPYGNVCIIDDGIGAGFGGGSGNTAYQFNTVQDFQNFVKGGPLWNIGAPLFTPGNGFNGVSTLTLIQARTAGAATITFTSTTAPATAVFTTKDLGLNANGVSTGGKLTQGYGLIVTLGVVDPTKVIFSMYHGTYKGIDSLNNIPWDGVAAAQAAPQLIWQSPECGSLTDLKTFCDGSQTVQAGFTYVIGTDTLVAGDAHALILAVGGTETYGASDFTTSVALAKAVDNSIFLATKYNTNATDAHNDAILSMILGSKYMRFLVVGGGPDLSTLSSVSFAAATHFNNDQVIIIHGDGKLTTRTGFKRVDTFYKAACVVGRAAGLEPQVPLTWKQIGIDAEWQDLSEDNQEAVLAHGVLATIYDSELGYNLVLQDCTSIQSNDYLVNDDGTSFSWSVKRIEAQLNKELAIYLKRKFFSNQTGGPNRNTVTEQDLVAATEAYLQSRIASSIQDNLIIRFDSVVATVNQDNYYVSYNFVPNFPVNKIIVTGVILES